MIRPIKEYEIDTPKKNHKKKVKIKIKTIQRTTKKR